MIYRWSIRWGALPQDAEEVIQETLLTIHQKLYLYEVIPGSKFRSWLKTVAFHCWLQLRQNPGFLNVSADPNMNSHRNPISTTQARDDLINEFQRIADQEILDFASQRVKSRVDEKAWNCFDLNYFHELPGPEVADRLGMSLNAVYLTTCRLRRMLREEIVKIDPPESNQAPSSGTIDGSS